MNEYDGELTTWRPDGMKVVQTYKNGVANGWQKNYNSQGALMGEIMMKNGRATGNFVPMIRVAILFKRAPTKTML